MVGLMIVPLPTFVLDVLIASNITLGIVLLVASLYMRGGLSLTTFPTILLLTTLYRLALNVSSTRLILLQADAGDVIHAFGYFVVEGNYVVGAVVFAIITLIQFVVVARGSERVAEVGARFTLDAMPGKQMSIDAELRTGAITQREARMRRQTLQRESEFYGAMDGAMKFVKGDAIAGLAITAINIVGGLGIGVAMGGMPAGEAIETYGLLTIGDGLVSQIPALLISVGAGLVVTRVSAGAEGSLGADVAQQFFSNPRALWLAGGFLVLLGAVPGLPLIPFLLMGAALWFVAFRVRRTPQAEELPEQGTQFRVSPPPVQVRLGEGVQRSDALDALVNSCSDRLYAEMGVEAPSIDVVTGAGDTTIAIDGVRLAALNSRATSQDVANALDATLTLEAHRLFGIQQTQDLLDGIAASHPAVVSVVTKAVSLQELTEVLRLLLLEGVALRPLRPILEAVAMASKSKPYARIARVRERLGRLLTHRFEEGGAIHVHRLDPMVEDAIREAVVMTDAGPILALAPELANDIIGAVKHASTKIPILVSSDIRQSVFGLLRGEAAVPAVLGLSELEPGLRIETVAVLRP